MVMTDALISRDNSREETNSDEEAQKQEITYIRTFTSSEKKSNDLIFFSSLFRHNRLERRSLCTDEYTNVVEVARISSN